MRSDIDRSTCRKYAFKGIVIYSQYSAIREIGEIKVNLVTSLLSRDWHKPCCQWFVMPESYGAKIKQECIQCFLVDISGQWDCIQPGPANRSVKEKVLDSQSTF
jgi:hypothetical protein